MHTNIYNYTKQSNKAKEKYYKDVNRRTYRIKNKKEISIHQQLHKSINYSSHKTLKIYITLLSSSDLLTSNYNVLLQLLLFTYIRKIIQAVKNKIIHLLIKKYSSPKCFSKRK